MLNLEGFYPVAHKNVPGNYGLKYRCKQLGNGSCQYRFLFSRRTMREQGWECGDYIWLAYDQDQEAFGFSKCEAGAPYARKLRRKDATRTGCMITVQGDLGLPELEGSIELVIATDEYWPCEASLIAQFPDRVSE
jgi:hypothetical protein